MKANDFIKKHIDVEEDYVSTKNLKIRIERLETYVNYLKLLEKKNYCQVLDILFKEQFSWQGFLKNHFNDIALRRMLLKLESYGFIEDGRPNSTEMKILSDYMSEYHCKTVIVIRLTNKGKDFYKLNQKHIQEVVKA